MKTIEAIARVSEDGSISVTAQLPPGTEPGEYKAVLVLSDTPAAPLESRPKPPLRLHAWRWTNWPDDFTFRREDIY